MSSWVWVLVVGLPVAIEVGNILGFLSCRKQAHFDFGQAPWNWRILTGPWLYLSWLGKERSSNGRCTCGWCTR
jgi:hypothetical protein